MLICAVRGNLANRPIKNGDMGAKIAHMKQHRYTFQETKNLFG
jgi:hypothetical protein